MPEIPAIVFQNEHFVAVDKPANVLTTPPRFSDDRRILGRELEKQLKTQLWPVHRLDFEVSGLVLFAISEEAHRTSNIWFEKRMVRKQYEALTEIDDTHKPADLSGPRVWHSRLLRGKKRAYEHKAGKKAVTEATALEQFELNGSATVKWLLQPKTGRPHQLRYELSHHGFPILGDTLYGSTQNWPTDGIALRSLSLEFSIECKFEEWKLPEKISVEAFSENLYRK